MPSQHKFVIKLPTSAALILHSTLTPMHSLNSSHASCLTLAAFQLHPTTLHLRVGLIVGSKQSSQAWLYYRSTVQDIISFGERCCSALTLPLLPDHQKQKRCAAKPNNVRNQSSSKDQVEMLQHCYAALHSLWHESPQ